MQQINGRIHAIAYGHTFVFSRENGGEVWTSGINGKNRPSLPCGYVHSPQSFLYIDELFCRLDGLPEPIIEVGRAIQARVLQWTALPVGVGIGHTKTLAKAAQHASKVWREKTGGVVDRASLRQSNGYFDECRLMRYGG